MLATQLLEEINFLSSSCTKKSVWVKLTRQIRISVLEIGNHIIHHEDCFPGQGKKGMVSLNGSQVSGLERSKVVIYSCQGNGDLHLMGSHSGNSCNESFSRQACRSFCMGAVKSSSPIRPRPTHPTRPNSHITSPRVRRYSGQV